MIKVKCFECGKDFYCNGDTECIGSYEAGSIAKDGCVCKECSLRIKEYREIDTNCSYKTVEDVEGVKVKFT